jgi:flagellar hook protein FlgE
MELGANLPSSAATGDEHRATAQIFDAQGNAHDLSIRFTKTANVGEWSYEALPPAGATAISNNTGTVTFNGDGSPSADVTLTPNIQWSTGAADSDIEIDLGTGNGFDGLTNFATDFSGFTELNQNGLKFGSFTGVQVAEDGKVTAIFDNGRRKDIYQLPVAVFNNPNGLEERSGNAFLQTNESGDFLLSESGQGGAGSIAPSALEASTVDLGTEFTNMITTQRAYSAATKVITTSDEMLQELTQAIR